MGVSPDDLGERIDGESGAERLFDCGRADRRAPGDSLGGGKALGEGRHVVGHILERIARRDHQPEIVEVERAHRCDSNPAMTDMGGVERTAEQAGAAQSPALFQKLTPT